MPNPYSTSQRLFLGWIEFSYRHAAWILLTLLLLAVIATGYTARNLGIYTDTADMLSEDLPFRVNLARFNESFPQYDETLLLVLDAPTPEQAHQAATRLTAFLQAAPASSGEIYHLSGEEFFQINGLLYNDPDELAQLADRLSAAQPLIARISRDPTLHTFLEVLNEAIEALRTGRELELAAILRDVATTLKANESGTRHPLSWQALFQEDDRKTSYREFITLKPELDFEQLFPAEQIISTIRDAVRELDLEGQYATQLRITGEVALSHEELNSAMLGAQDAGVIALICVAVILFVALRSIGSVITVLVSLMLGLMLTAAFATVAVGHLNLISIAFAVLYIGLGVDYAIHLLLRYAELAKDHRPGTEILLIAGRDTGRSLIICALTTAIGFYAFTPTDYSGIAELGVISGTGMLISLVVTLTAVPALQRFLPVKAEALHKRTITSWLATHWLRKPRAVLLVTLLTALASATTLPYVQFDHNLLNMQNPQGEAVRTFRELLADKDHTPWFGAIPAHSLQKAEQLTRELAQLPEVNKVISISDFVPTQQTEKLALIDDIALTLGPDFFAEIPQRANAHPIEQQQAILETLQQSLERFVAERPEHPTSSAAYELSTTIGALRSRLAALNPPQSMALLEAINQDLLGLLPDSLERLQKALTAEAVDIQTLPESLRVRWQSATGDYLVLAYPASNIDDNEALRRFVRTVQQHAPQLSGTPAIILEAGDAVVNAFIQAFALALIGAVLTLLWLLRSVASTVLVLIPLLLAALFTVTATVVFHIPFNFANIIALPLLLGIGIDSSIHMVTRSRHHRLTGHGLLHTSTARAIFYSAMSTMAGFGSLSFSTHLGTASMGLLLAIGVFFILVCVFLVLPNLLQVLDRTSMTINKRESGA
jgi:uncharacterized protein